MQKTEGEHGSELVWMRYCRAVLTGGAAAFGTAVVLLFLCSLGIAGGTIPGDAESRLMVIICGAAGFLGGGIARYIGRDRGLVLGLCAGLVLFLLQVTAGLLFCGGAGIEQGGGLLLASLTGGGAAGLLLKGRRHRKRTH